MLLDDWTWWGWGWCWEWGHKRLPHWFMGFILRTKTCGTNYKIPILHHKFQEREWTAVARILAFEWQKFQFFPVLLAPPFLTEALSLSCSDTNLLEAFFNYISATEKDVLTEALSNFKGTDMDELLSILSSHNCCVLPTEENLPRLLEEIAHKDKGTKTSIHYKVLEASSQIYCTIDE